MHHDIGETAGKVWRHLHQRGPATVAEIATGVGCQREAVERAIGWLAREDKLEFHGTGYGERISLTKEAVAAEAPKKISLTKEAVAAEASKRISLNKEAVATKTPKSPQ